MYKYLAAEIIIKAIEDYKLLKEYDCKKLVVEDENTISIEELEEFFNSKWCDYLLSELSGFTGKDILRLLQDQ